MVSAVRIEYLTAYSRKVRWTEEVALINEEMRRVLQFLIWKASWWRSRDCNHTGLLGAGAPVDRLADGLSSYAARQAAMYDRLGAKFRRLWAPVYPATLPTSHPARHGPPHHS
jgi:hypothetical protein